MKSEIKKKWIEALKSKKYKSIGHRLGCGNNMFCAMGVLCQLHSEDTKTEWGTDFFYFGQYIAAPKEVLDWAEIKESQQSDIIIANNDHTVDDYVSAVKYIEENL